MWDSTKTKKHIVASIVALLERKTSWWNLFLYQFNILLKRNSKLFNYKNFLP